MYSKQLNTLTIYITKDLLQRIPNETIISFIFSCSDCLFFALLDSISCFTNHVRDHKQKRT